MKQWITGAAMVALALGYSQRADASISVTINDGDGHVFSCDNSTATTIAACSPGIFANLTLPNNIVFLGTFGDYTFGGASGVNANVPGDLLSGFTTDSKISVTHDKGATDLTVTFAAYGFTLPLGIGNFSSSATGNWTVGAASDFGTFAGWADPNNGVLAGVGTLADSGACTTAGGTTKACSTESPHVVFNNINGTYSLVGKEVIHLAVDSQDRASFTSTETFSAVPEPMTFSLMGAGLLGLGLLRRKLR